MIRVWIPLGLCLSCALACGSAKELPTRSLSAAQSLDDQVVWLDQNNDEALTLDVGASHPEPRVDSYGLPAKPQYAERRNGANELLVLLTDAEDDSGKLAVLGPRGVDRVYEVGAQFDAIAQSDDGHFAIVYFSPNGTSQVEQSTLLFNPNEIAIVDLERKGKEAVVGRTLRSLGAAPQRVEFSPPMTIAGETRRLAVVFFQSEVALLDLNHTDRPEYTVELSRGSNLVLTHIRFSPDDQKIYLLASGSNDVFVLHLLEASGNRSNDFEPSLNQLGTDSAPQDMAIFESDGQRKLLVASTNSAQVVEASSSRVTEIPLANAADRILLFEGASPFDSDVQQRALLYRLGSAGVTFLDLADIEERTTRNREELGVPAIRSLVPLKDNLVLLNHQDGSLDILNLDERTASPIQARIQLDEAIPNLEQNRIWVAPVGQPTVGFIDLLNLHPGQVVLDQPISQLLQFQNTRSPKIVITHPDLTGAVSILSAEDPTDTTRALTLQGFFYAGVLDR
jgi:hypothetical protein